jgi:chromate transporter
MGINFLIIFLITGLAFEGFVMKKNVILIPALIVNIVLIILVSLGSINQSLDFLSNLGLGIAPSPEIWRLFILGFLAGLLSFGGAYAAIPYVQQEAVILGGWISLQAFLDGIAIVQVLPAPLVIFSTFVGFYGNTWGGAFIMTIGMFLPAFAFTLLGHNLFEKVIENEKISVFLDGITAGVVGLITCTAISITKFALTDPNYAQFNVLIFLASLWSLHTFKSFKYLNPCMVFASALCGQIFFRDLAL